MTQLVKQKKLWALAGVVALGAALLGIVGPSGAASTTPPWEPDAQSLGGITFYNAAGAVVTSGNDLTNAFAYVAANSATPHGATNKAYVSFGFPKAGQLPSQWFNTTSLGATPFPITTAPAPVNAITFPVSDAVQTSTNNLTTSIGQGTFDTTAGYNNILEVRLGDSGGGFNPDPTSYWSADIQIDQANHTWTQIYPTAVTGPTATSTAVTSSVPSPQATSANITFTATVSPAAAAGTVQFKNDGTAIGSAQAVSSGTATLATTGTALGAGDHTITAVFTPTSTTAFSASTSSGFPYTITAAGPTTTTTAVTASVPSPQPNTASVTFTATVSPSAAAGTVQFKNDGTAIGSAQAVSGGTATLATTGTALGVGAHTITAVFTPTSTTDFTTSTSPGFPYTITSTATATTTALTADPASPITHGTTTTLHATVTPATAVGTVQFVDGATNLGSPVTVSGGTAASAVQTFTTGTHSLTAVFTPTSTDDFTTSTSTALPYDVNSTTGAATTTTLTVSPDGPQVYGTSVTLTAGVTPTTAVGKVEFFSGGTEVGAGVTVDSGAATLTTTALPAGDDSIVAKFVPTNFDDFLTSQSAAKSYTVTPAASTVALVASPEGTAQQGTSVTLSATVGPIGVGDGTVQFEYLVSETATLIGDPVAVTDKNAVLTTADLPMSTTNLGAIFKPSSANYSTSPPTVIAYTITKAPPTGTSVSLVTTPTGPAASGTVETLTATVTPATAAGTVAFMDGSTQIGSPITVTDGTASTTTTLTDGSHDLKVMFAPADSDSFSTSEGGPFTYEVTAAAKATTTTLAVGPAASDAFGTSVTFTATVAPAGAGTVTFKDGDTTLGTGPVDATTGVATLTNGALTVGAHSVIASFAPTDPLSFAASASTATTVTITQVATVTALAITPAGPVAVGASVTMTATVTPATAAGTVSFKNGTTDLGSAAVASGVATVVTKVLPAGTASITATFTPTDAVNNAASTSAASTISVLGPPVTTGMTSGGSDVASGGTVEAGATLDLGASGFVPGETVTIEAHSDPVSLGTAVADSSGNVDASVTLPTSLKAGAHSITITGALGTATFKFTIAAAAGSSSSGSSSSSGGGDLAHTGTNVEYGLILGLLLLAAGLLLVAVTLRRRRAGAHE